LKKEDGHPLLLDSYAHNLKATCTVASQKHPEARRRERYDPVNLFELMPKLRLEMEPALAALDRRPIPPTCVVVVHKKIQEDE
jgi:hypothetical protein